MEADKYVCMWFTPTRVYVHGGSKRVGTLVPASNTRGNVHGGPNGWVLRVHGGFKRVDNRTREYYTCIYMCMEDSNG